jgi:hypothetical protein
MKLKTQNKPDSFFLILAIAVILVGSSLLISPFSATANPASGAGTKVQKSQLQITDAKTAVALDSKLMPVQPTSIFPRDTRRAFCWFAWDNAIPKAEIKADWNYAADDTHILTYAFRLPRQKGSGGISLIMPTGKVFPVGSYRVDLMEGDRVLKSLTFSVK